MVAEPMYNKKQVKRTKLASATTVEI